MTNLPLAKPATVLAAVADAYNIPVKDLTQAGRVARPAPDARKVAARILHEDCRWPWERVGGLLNRTADYTKRSAAHADMTALNVIRTKLYNGNQPALW
jgi:hypothetical protein